MSKNPICGSRDSQNRRLNIVNRLKKESFVQTTALSAEFGVSAITIRKDLEFLENKGLLKRIHGGAQLSENALSFLDFTERYMVNRTLKFAIACEAAKLLDKPDSYIFIDTGTTNSLFAREIPRNIPLTIFTNSISTIAALEGRTNCEVITFGGRLDYKNKFFQGPLVDEQLRNLSFNFSFIGADSISEEGFGCNDLIQAGLLRKIISRSKAAYVLADSSKIGKSANNTYASLSEVTALITDYKAEQSFITKLERKNCKVIVAK